MPIDVQFYNDTKIVFPVDETASAEIIKNTLKDLGFESIDISVIALDKDELAEMKEEYFKEAVDTDVITFTLDTDPVLEGEIYCGLEQIRENSQSFGQTFEREFARILIHGSCHLSGQEDSSPEERAQMTGLENTYLTKYYDPLCQH